MSLMQLADRALAVHSCLLPETLPNETRCWLGRVVGRGMRGEATDHCYQVPPTSSLPEPARSCPLGDERSACDVVRFRSPSLQAHSRCSDINWAGGRCPDGRRNGIRVRRG